MEFNAVRINSAPDVLVQEIISQIKSGKLQPGEVLPSQRDLAKMFNVGLGSVREAIKILDVMGHVKVVRGKGTYISDTPPRQPQQKPSLETALEAMSVAELVKAREIVECGAARLAAENATPGDIRTLEMLGKKMDGSFSDTDLFYKLDFEFHIAVAEASNNKALIEMVKLLVHRSHKHVTFMSESLNIAVPFTVEKAVYSAREVIAQIKAGDPQMAEICMNKHLNIVYSELDKEFLNTRS